MARVHRLSTHEIVRISKAWVSEISSEKLTDLSTIQHFFNSSQFGLSAEEIKDTELVLLLLASAHKTGNKQFDDASKGLNLCDFLSSDKGNSVQRVVHYFAKALQQKIARETRTVLSDESESSENNPLCPAEIRMGADPALISCCLQLPCLQAVHFAAIQAVIDSLESAKTVHFIDLGIKTGSHCTILMQALANRQSCAIELLKISGVGITASRQRIEDAGKRLASFAQTLHIPFSFRTAIVANIKDLKVDMFEINDGETVAIFLPGILRFIKAQKGALQSLLRVLRKLNPCVMVIIEAELNHNSPWFIDQFHELLLFYSACYDGVEGCIAQCDPNRITIEACLGQEIRDVVAVKAEERIFKHMKIDEWRDYFIRFGMEEAEISMSSFYQAELLVKSSASGKSCLLVKHGKCLLTGWKGTPIFSLSAWKFQQKYSKKICAEES
ncbi:DELLA protein GAI1-like isoform X1 [Mercurialis annua]|uniref:DELLA protein GAI1-like isoform X1 n=1 Tax=Mercurialis annua TaxID=3986 RepID=UPI00215F052F|nr:DELLA protein GAI1-like isoform X1 [Mercurialis annua]